MTGDSGAPASRRYVARADAETGVIAAAGAYKAAYIAYEMCGVVAPADLPREEAALQAADVARDRLFDALAALDNLESSPPNTVA